MIRAFQVEGSAAPLLPEAHDAAPDSYFSDAVFIGDSIMGDIEALDLFPEAEYVARIGMTVASFRYKQFKVRGTSEQESGYDAVARRNPKKVYILLGANGLDITTSEAILNDYNVMLDRLLPMIPDAIVYAICPPAVTKKKHATEKNIPSAGRYRNFAEGLQEICRQRGIYYIDLYGMTLDDDGYMKPTCAAGDGYHINFDMCRTLADYIKCHTVPYGAE